MIKNEWKSLLRNKLMLVVVIAIIVIPIIYAGLFLKSMWDPYGNVDSLPVAVVNEDKPVEYNGKTLSIGKDMTDELKTQVTESMRDEMSKQIADELGLPEDAFTADASIDGNTMNINMTMDVSKMGDTYANSSLDEFAQTIEDDLNATCQ